MPLINANLEVEGDPCYYYNMRNKLGENFGSTLNEE